MKDFKDKVVVITGGATGIGYSFAKRFGELGARLVIIRAGHRDTKTLLPCRARSANLAP